MDFLKRSPKNTEETLSYKDKESQDNLIKPVYVDNEIFRLSEIEAKYGVHRIKCSAFNQELQLLVRAEGENDNFRKTLFFYDLKQKRLKGRSTSCFCICITSTIKNCFSTLCILTGL